MAAQKYTFERIERYFAPKVYFNCLPYGGGNIKLQLDLDETILVEVWALNPDGVMEQKEISPEYYAHEDAIFCHMMRPPTVDALSYFALRDRDGNRKSVSYIIDESMLPRYKHLPNLIILFLDEKVRQPGFYFVKKSFRGSHLFET
jgi:hypothetical protein